MTDIDTEYLHDLAIKYGFVIIKPDFCGEHKSIVVQVPTPEIRDFFDNWTYLDPVKPEENP